MIAFFLGGLALFLYGQFLIEKDIQKTSRHYLRALIRLLTKHRITAILVGSILTVGMQSSTVPILTLIDLVNMGLLKLGSAIGIVLGASIGTTVTVQILSFDVERFALWLVIIGFFISRLMKYGHGELVVGLGFIFYGMYLMGCGVALIRETNLAGFLYTNPIQNMLGAFILTMVSQSTLAPMGIGIALIRNGGLGLANAIPIILGSHVGAGVLPLIYSWRISGSDVGRQLGIANLIYRVIGVVLFIPLIGPLASIIHWLSVGPDRQFANAHTIFTLSIVALFLPLTGLYTSFIKKIIPERGLHFVQRDLTMQKTRLAQEVYNILNDSIRLWEEDNLKEIEKIEKRCFSIHLLKEDIFKQTIDIGLAEWVNELAKISDIIGTKLVNLARKRVLQGIDFSIEGLNEILTIHRRIIDESNTNPDNQIESLISASFKRHIERMQKGFKETRETVSLHTDALAILEYIHWHVQKIQGLTLQSKVFV